MKKYLFAIFYFILLSGFTLFVVLDTFVLKVAPETLTIPVTIKPTPTFTPAPASTSTSVATETQDSGRGQEDTEIVTVATATPTPTETPTPTVTITPTWTENGYVDSNMTVTITKYREYDSDIFVADLILSSADILKTQLSSAYRSKSNWEVVSNISSICENLVISINGDCWASRSGYSIKNGVVLRDTVTKYTKGFTREEPMQEDYVLFSDGTAKVIREGETTVEELIEQGVWQLFNFGPVLIDDYKDVSRTSVTTSNVAAETAPRTAIGMKEDLHYVFIVVDGRSWTKALNYMNKGVTCYELAEFGMKLGLKSLYNLDGGGSSTLYFNGEVLNRPCRNGRTIEEQTVSDIIYVGY